MRVYLVLCVAASFVNAARAECSGCIDGRCYQKHRLPLSGDRIWPLDIHRSKNILYFLDTNVIRQCQLDSELCGDTNVWYSVFSLTVDQNTGAVYGYADGIYQLDFIHYDPEMKLPIRDRVRYATFKDKLYYVNFESGICSFENGESRIVNGTEEYSQIGHFIVDRNDDIYFETVMKGRDVITWLSDGEVNQTVYWDKDYCITVDRDGNAVFVHKESHALYRVTNGKLIEVGVINDSIYHDRICEPPLFDRDDNVVYKTNSLDVFYLKQDRDINCTYSVSHGATVITETVSTSSSMSTSTSAPTSTSISTPRPTPTPTPISTSTSPFISTSSSASTSTFQTTASLPDMYDYTITDYDDIAISTPASELTTSSLSDESVPRTLAPSQPIKKDMNSRVDAVGGASNQTSGYKWILIYLFVCFFPINKFAYPPKPN